MEGRWGARAGAIAAGLVLAASGLGAARWSDRSADAGPEASLVSELGRRPAPDRPIVVVPPTSTAPGTRPTPPAPSTSATPPTTAPPTTAPPTTAPPTTAPPTTSAPAVPPTSVPPTTLAPATGTAAPPPPSEAPVPDDPVASLARAASPGPALPVPAPAPTEAYFPEELIDLGRIDIPALGVSEDLHQGISLHNIDRGPSHWPGTALPGEIGNVVVAGHRVTHGGPFRRIHELTAGDEVIFEVDGVRSVYRVTDAEVVTPDGVHIVDQTAARTATLFACHPPGSARFRYVVHLVLDEAPT